MNTVVWPTPEQLGERKQWLEMVFAKLVMPGNMIQMTEFIAVEARHNRFPEFVRYRFMVPPDEPIHYVTLLNKLGIQLSRGSAAELTKRSPLPELIEYHQHFGRRLGQLIDETLGVNGEYLVTVAMIAAAEFPHIAEMALQKSGDYVMQQAFDDSLRVRQGRIRRPILNM